MNLWLLTNTTYGTWLPGDHKWSYTDVTGTMKLTAPQPRLAEHARALCKTAPVHLSKPQAEAALTQLLETCQYRGWTLHAGAVMHNHFHLIVGDPSETAPKKIFNDLKAYTSRVLNARYNPGERRKWWTRDGSPRLLPNERAYLSARGYVLERQPNPLVIYDGVAMIMPQASNQSP
ncbi:MAG: transposase [Lacipirellulaceae bacterium]